jgi:peptidoglycan hydrolase-like protein with peptidoglycan-binding domain
LLLAFSGTKPPLRRFDCIELLWEETMRNLRYGIAVGLLAGLGACSNMMGSSNSSPAPVAMTQPTVAPDMVKQVQSKLHDGGYYKQGPVDGVWGSGTESAVRSFQKDHNLGSSGQLDVPTLQALNVTSGPVAANNPPPADRAPTQPTGNYSNPPPADNSAAPPSR